MCATPTTAMGGVGSTTARMRFCVFCVRVALWTLKALVLSYIQCSSDWMSIGEMLPSEQ